MNCRPDTEPPVAFIDYWHAIDAAMMRLFDIDTTDAGLDADMLAAAQEDGQTPEEFARWFGEKHGLRRIKRLD